MTNQTHFPVGRCAAASALALLVLLGLVVSSLPAAEAGAVNRTYDLPEDNADKALRRFSEQSGIQVIFPSEIVRDVRANAVRGKFTAREALDQMFAGSGLVAVQDAKTGALTVRRGTADPKGSRAAPTGLGARRPSDEAKAAAADEAVVLSPFEVSVASDQGYAARETLAGTRFKTELKNVPSQISVMTKEFLQDIASVSVEDAYRYSINVENTTEYNAPSAGGGDFTVGTISRSANRVRGISYTGNTHDFFRTNIQQDTYNVERVSYSSGPNAILFGNGNPGGIVDTAFLRANLQKPRYEVSLRHDNYGSQRASVDLNQPFYKDVLGFRFAAVKSRQNSWREPCGRDDDRYFGTFTLRPTKSTTVRAYFEDAMIDNTPARNTRMGDGITTWIKAGRPAFNNGLVNPTVVTDANSTYFLRYTNTRRMWVPNGGAPGTPYEVWGAAATANIALPTTRYAAQTRGPGGSQSGVDQYIYSLPYDESLYPFDVSVTGNGTRIITYGQVAGLSLEQRLPGNVFFQADYNRERVTQPSSDFLRGSGADLLADPNLYLPDRVTPNPNFGRYFVESAPRTVVFRGKFEEYRAMLSYELDLTKQPGWRRWLGRHQSAALYQRSFSFERAQDLSGARVIPAGTSPEAALNNFSAAAYNSLLVRTYVSNPLDPAMGNNYYLKLPFDPLRASTFMLPDGGTWVGSYKNPYGVSTSQNMLSNLAEGKVFALQSFLLGGRLVTSFGWRRDRVREASYTTQRKTSAPNSAFETIMEAKIPTNWSNTTKGATNTQGAVLHVLPWLSAFYNQSSTWNPTTGLINPDDGTKVQGETGKGKDYGVMLRFFSDRVSLRLNKYENTSGPSGNTSFRNAIVPVVQNIENTLIDRSEDGTLATPVPRPKFYDPEVGTYIQSGLFADVVSKGYEAEIVANPLRNWRLSLSGAKSEATASNIGRPWINFINERASIWAANSTLTGPEGTATSIATRYLAIIQTLNQMKQADGQKVENARDWRVNFVTRYSFSEGFLRGSFVGAGQRYRSPQALGYLARMVPNEFKLPGAPAQVLVPAREAPIEGKGLYETELFLGYTRRLTRSVNWRVQLNVRNLFDDRDPMAQRANITYGYTSVYTLPEPRSFILTNTFTF